MIGYTFFDEIDKKYKIHYLVANPFWIVPTLQRATWYKNPYNAQHDMRRVRKFERFKNGELDVLRVHIRREAIHI